MIFLGGIHGVGKTSMLNIVKQKSNIPIYSASALIAYIKNDKYIQSKSRNDIIGDQNILLQAIREYIKVDNYILDGHFCLINTIGEIERIPKNVFLQLPIIKIFVLSADIDEIIQRLYKRDGKKYKFEDIYLFQKLEIEYAREIAYEKSVSLDVIYDEKEFLNYIGSTK